jgi:hypothetical protein
VSSHFHFSSKFYRHLHHLAALQPVVSAVHGIFARLSTGKKRSSCGDASS